ncbi:MAG: cold shock domain-containing protein [Bacteroidota bacterium]
MAEYRSVVKWFDAKKGYGFLVHPDGGEDIFVHYTQIDTERRFRTLRTGQVVEFDLEDGAKGLHAHNVLPVPEPQEMRLYKAPSPDEIYAGNGGSMS